MLSVALLCFIVCLFSLWCSVLVGHHGCICLFGCILSEDCFILLFTGFYCWYVLFIFFTGCSSLITFIFPLKHAYSVLIPPGVVIPWGCLCCSVESVSLSSLFVLYLPRLCARFVWRVAVWLCVAVLFCSVLCCCLFFLDCLSVCERVSFMGVVLFSVCCCGGCSIWWVPFIFSSERHDYSVHVALSCSSFMRRRWRLIPPRKEKPYHQ